MATESKYQRKVKSKLEAEGWFVIRMITVTSTGFNSGMPDLLAIKHDVSTGENHIRFVEVKAANGKTSKLQDYAHSVLKANGFQVEIDTDGL